MLAVPLALPGKLVDSAPMTFRELSAKVRLGHTLDECDIAEACNGLLDEEMDVCTRAGFLSALHERGERPEELVGFARQLLGRATPFPASGVAAIDVCGTGGDRAGFFNISTAVMFVAAGAGARVAKHGNRGITSRSGGADALEALGVRIDLAPEVSARNLDDVGCCFLFAPMYHPAVRAVAPVRKVLAEEGTPSIFNLLGPLLNPAQPCFQMVGIYDPEALELYAAALHGLGRTRAWALQGKGPDSLCLDEVSISGPTVIHEVLGGSLREFSFDVATFGLPFAHPQELVGGDAAENARLIEGILCGTIHGPPRDIVLANAAAALVVSALAKDMHEGLLAAKKAIDSGAAAEKLRLLRKNSA